MMARPLTTAKRQEFKCEACGDDMYIVVQAHHHAEHGQDVTGSGWRMAPRPLTLPNALLDGSVIAKSDLYDAVYAALVVGRMDWWMRQDRIIGDDLAALITDGLWTEATL
jgi:hypothetical protein